MSAFSPGAQPDFKREFMRIMLLSLSPGDRLTGFFDDIAEFVRYNAMPVYYSAIGVERTMRGCAEVQLGTPPLTRVVSIDPLDYVMIHVRVTSDKG